MDQNLKIMKSHLLIASILLRLGLAATFLSAVASRLGFWGENSSGWENFVEYTAAVNSFAPAGIIPLLAVSATILETGLSILLIIGYKTRWTALGTALLTFVFALAMTYSFGIKNPLDYSVFVDCTAAYLLASLPNYKWSLDEYLKKSYSNH